MNFLPKDTLAWFEAMPQKKALNLKNIKVLKFSESTKKYREGAGQASPDAQALEFYAANHFYSLVSMKFTKNEALTKEALGFAEFYSDVLASQGERLMHYMLLIITREARHSKGLSESFKDFILQKSSKEMVKFLTNVISKGEQAAVDSYLSSPPGTSIGNYTFAIELLFDTGSWGSQFGGKPWGKIARTLSEMMHGKISLEMMVDTAYTLAHNNGPMFNKGMLYTMYSNEFKMILDVQRAGMIPELILNASKYGVSAVSSTLLKMTNLAASNFKTEIKEDVDWEKVMSLGSLGNYKHLIKKSKCYVPPVEKEQDKVLEPGVSTPTPTPSPTTSSPPIIKGEVKKFYITTGEWAYEVARV